MPERNQSPLLIAGGNITTHSFVKLSTSADHTALQADANEQVIGISQVGTATPPGVDGSTTYAAVAGGHLQIFGLGDICLLRLGSGGCTRGNNLKSDADGNGVVAASTGTTVQNIGAVALQSGSEGELVEVQVQIMKTRPALT